jgi:hypothetical protein
MQETRDREKIFRDLVTSLNRYVQKRDTTQLESFKKILASAFSASDVSLFVCNKESMALSLLGTKGASVIEMDRSLTEYVIHHKKSLIENHIKSNRYFNVEVDNPLDLKVKSLLISPVMREKKVMGLVKIWRGVRQRSNFVKRDEDLVVFLHPVFVALFESTPIEKERLLHLLGKKVDTAVQVKKSSPSKEPTKTPSPSPKKISKKSELKSNPEVIRSQKEEECCAHLEEIDALNASKEKLIAEIEAFRLELERQTTQIEELNEQRLVLEERIFASKEEEERRDQKYHTQSEAYQATIARLKEEQSQEKELSKKQESTIERLNHELGGLTDSYAKIESDSMRIVEVLEKERKTSKRLKEKLLSLRSEHEVLEERLKRHEESSQTIQELRAQQTQKEESKTLLAKGREEELIGYFSKSFGLHAHSYSLFEILLYALSSNKGMKQVEETLDRTRVLQDLLENFYFRGDIDPSYERYSMREFMNHLERYEEEIFDSKIMLDISLSKEMPSSLVFDRIKTQSILLHLLFDLYQFVDYESHIHLLIAFEERSLIFELGGTIHHRNSLFNQMFKQSRLALDNRERVSLQLGRKLIERLKGSLHFDYKNEYYRFIMKLPAQTIKL